jgi:hypothetical protein
MTTPRTFLSVTSLSVPHDGRVDSMSDVVELEKVTNPE